MALVNRDLGHSRVLKELKNRDSHGKVTVFTRIYAYNDGFGIQCVVKAHLLLGNPEVGDVGPA